MLDHWLRNCDLEKRNWREVARALRQIEYQQLAKDIENIDKAGSYDNHHEIQELMHGMGGGGGSIGWPATFCIQGMPILANLTTHRGLVLTATVSPHKIVHGINTEIICMPRGL